MQLLVCLSIRDGFLFSPLLPRRAKQARLAVTMPCSVQDLRDSDDSLGLACLVNKWLSSFEPQFTTMMRDRFNEKMHDFMLCVHDANTHGIIFQDAYEIVEFTMVFTNIPFDGFVDGKTLEELQKLTKGITLDEQG